MIEASSIIQEAAHEDANIIFGAVLDEKFGDEVKFTVIATGFREAMPARRERMMAASALPTAHHEIVPPRIVSRPLVPKFSHEEEPAEPSQPLIYGSQAQRPTIRFASETEVEEALGGGVGEPRTAVPEPVASVPLQRTTYPVSSYYETARQQAWQEPAPRVEYAPPPEEQFEPVRPAAPEFPRAAAPEFPRAAAPEPVRLAVAEVAEEPKAVAPAEAVAVPVPVVVEHIAEVTAGSRIEAPRPVAERPGPEGYGAEIQGAPVARESAPELIPVRASVFDDDFFRRPSEESAARTAEDAASKPWPDARVPSFAGYAGESAAENDELDIPAFLRRKQ